MKSISLLLLGCSLCAGEGLPKDHSLTEDQQKALHAEKAQWAKKTRADLLHHHGAADEDGDGQLSAADLATHADKLTVATAKGKKARGRQLGFLHEFFSAADADKDGGITGQEFIDAFIVANKHKGSAGEGQPLTAADRESLTQHAAQEWGRVAQGKAKLPKAEAVEMSHGFHGAAKELVKNADRNGDLKLSLSEMQKVKLDEVPHELLVVLVTHDASEL